MILNLTDNLQLTLANSFSIYFEVGLISFIFIVLLITQYFAYQRLQKSFRFSIVALLNLVSFCALIGLISNLKIQSNTEVTGVLLTNGVSQEQIDSLQTDENISIFSLLSSFPIHNSLDISRVINKVTYIENVSEIFLVKPFMHRLDVYGDGLLSSQWQTLNAKSLSNSSSLNDHRTTKNPIANVNFFPSKVRTGAIELSWPKQLVLGQIFYIAGRFVTAQKDKDRIYTLTLSDLNDETIAELPVKNNDSFNMLASLKNQGLFDFQLKIFDDEKKLVASEPVAFTVTSSEKIKVAIKQSSASFESNHLKNWLTEQGAEVLVLTQVSKDKHIQQTFNSAVAQDFESDSSDKINKELSTSWLNDFALLYMDGRAFLSLSEDEVYQLDNAIKNGLGLAVIVDDELLFSSDKIFSNSLLSKIFTNNSIQVNTKGEQVLSTVPRWQYSREELPLTYKNVRLPTSNNNKVLIKGSEEQPLWLNHYYGLGTIAFSLIDSSYKWSISGEKTHYSHYWQTIIEQVSRHKQSSGWQKPSVDNIYYQGQAQQICAQLNKNDAGNVKIMQVNLVMSAVTESKYCGVYWASATGWHAFTLTSEGNDNGTKQVSSLIQDKASVTKQHVFLYEQDDWQTWQQALKHQASYLASKNASKATLDSVYIPINKQKIWWLFFLALSMLWYERKTF